MFLHCKGSNSFLFVNTTKIYQFKAKGPEIKPHPLFLRHILKEFFLRDFSIDYKTIDIADIINTKKK